MSIFAPFSSLITLLNIINMRMEKSILDILGMSLFQTTLSDFWKVLNSGCRRVVAEKSGR